ncbi:hypothetical protein IT084_01285 [Desulfallas sp. Bu1-1]|uniref:hypothetical protein n=1 Tax=Desulfallas sp. Bu1-1 TaxID=2787620 RepID=UPI00189D41EA|nr:hypothetical protein [Desulfallas sp. Bu1-1]MBF7081615.1 hypothetical protein [Desulfallas sp. Bu1-1]
MMTSIADFIDRARNKFIPAFIGLMLLAGLPGLPAAAEEILPAGQENTPAPVKLINREYIDTVTVNHPLFVDLLENGNYLVCRVGFNAPSVQEIDPAGRVVWSIDGVQPVSARRLPGGNTLVADSGAPGLPYAPRVLEVSPAGKVVWEHRFASLAESPRYAEKLANGNILVTLPFMIVELDRQHRVVWSYGSRKPLSPDSAGYLERPVMAAGLANGNVLVVDRGFAGGRVLEINKSKQVVWQFGRRLAELRFSSGVPAVTGDRVEAERSVPEFLPAPSYACRLENGNTLVTDLGTSRLVEIDGKGNIARELDWSAALLGYPVMNTWQAALAGDRLLPVFTLTNSHSRILELDINNLPALNRGGASET